MHTHHDPLPLHTTSDEELYTAPEAWCDDRRVEYRKHFQRFCEARRPMEQLPLSLTVNHELLKDPCYDGPIKVSFGIGVSFDTLIDYAVRRKLIEHHRVTEGSQDLIDSASNVAVYRVVEHLKNITGARYMWFSLPVALEVDVVIDLYDNYTKEDYEMEEQDEKEVFEIVRSELGIPADETPKWWFIQD
ncbi:hypothetical protein DENSPDRAFT_861609 [Dentipellis sp. KUC8613]|nr:hypothetical protein DENSPDRAFT_861609 [Dentipellis sp. KUC8613]